ncbi:hypothetical protein HYPSUDRAFT_474374 [Hypholoma sublateritium FD-334 SS-4]|uniref:C2H2-type domain-containing protein n=1 Tax=Hypholoma sublateritium (strain FD-334 SS-4) TaxID=945553 RepID=A0A0D2P0V8_HYPSF|nr:hypothetical protein HYPSUDRAFT_474374 [Hypholoma sublateritium FD-334 SS-4]
MALCESPHPGPDSAFAAFASTPPFMNTYPTTSTPLILHRDWPESYYMSSASDTQPDNYDFQSNHLETHLSFGMIPALAGLGIKNVDLDKEVENKPIKASPYHLGNPSPTEDFHRHCRSYRTDSIYDVAAGSGSFDTSQLQQSDCGLGSPWTLSSILRAAEFSVGSATTSELDHSLPSDPAPITTHLPDAPQALGDREEDVTWSLEKLSAATGLSVADFAAQLSATAEATLKRMGAGNDLDVSASLPPSISGNGEPPLMGTFGGDNKSLAWTSLSSETGLSLPFSDINLRTVDLSSWNGDCVGVDPAEILPNLQPSLSQVNHSGSVSTPSIDFGSSLPNVPILLAPAQNIHIMGLHYQTEQPLPIPRAETSSPPDDSYALPLLKNASRDAHYASDDDAFQSPSSSEYSPFLQPLGLKRNYSSRVTTRRNALQADPEPSVFEYASEAGQQHLPPVNLGTPVFDAHRGIDIEELKAKAERYRLRNQGREYDKRWLISFAGKLSVRGELVEEFRCYVAGCKQVNKRRDHILIHVGAHLDQRPFKCLHCSARFLRKNECKRHELSHTGVRPFSCHLCPVPATTFVRQDLLKRHMKRTHRLELKIDKENEEPARPKKRTKF